MPTRRAHRLTAYQTTLGGTPASWRAPFFKIRRNTLPSFTPESRNQLSTRLLHQAGTLQSQPEDRRALNEVFRIAYNFVTEIREYLEAKGFRGHEAAQIAAHQTRDKKQLLSREEVLGMHRDLAAQEGVTFARDKHFEREAVTDERTLLRDAMRRSMGDAPFADIRANYNQRHG